jgi:catechol-2,3-dioxygenase
MIQRVLAQMTVTDLDPAVEWYTSVFGRGPDARTMDGLVEWHFAETFGVSVWTEPGRAGYSTVVLAESDLDSRIAHLDRESIRYDGPRDVTASRLLELVDPDGNQIMFTGAFTT